MKDQGIGRDHLHRCATFVQPEPVVQLHRAEVGERMRETAQAQREACARHMVLSQDYSAQACRLAPLVTETEGDQ